MNEDASARDSGAVRAAVFDTNVIVSGVPSPHGAPGRIVDWLQQGSLRAVLDQRCAAEYEEVLGRPELHLPQKEVSVLLRRLLDNAEWVDIAPRETVSGLPDPDDAPFLECALKARCPLVTGNPRHFPARAARGIEVLSPSEFVRQISA
jgi:predicted nucleic acid-binding protein